jgi:hypothetical protein
MRPLRRITLVMRAAHSSPANTAVSLEPHHFGTWSRSGSNLRQQNCEADIGRYAFSVPEAVQRGQLLPLRTSSEAIEELS